MNLQIILASLRAHPVRTAVSVLAVTLEVILILLLVGLTNGVVEETGNRVAGVGADLIFMAPDASYMLGMNAAILPVRMMDKMIEVEGVEAVAPVVTQTNQGGGFNVIYGIEPRSFNAVSGGFEFLDGVMFGAPDEALIDDWYAEAENLRVGSRVEWLRHEFTITGVVRNGKGARVFIPIERAQEMTAHEGRATMFYIKVRDRERLDEVMAQLRDVFMGYQILDVREFASLMFSANEGLMDAFFQVIVFVGVCIGVLVIFLSMYTTITERTREIGILRSMGASRRFIIVLVLQESVMLCILGVVFGIGSSFVLADLLKRVFPTLVILITTEWLVQAAIFAILSGIIGALYPAAKAAAQDPIEALAYE